MSTIGHIYSPKQYARAVELWERLTEHPHTSVTVTGAYFSAITKLEPEHLHALVLGDGAETDEYEAVTLTLISYSDYGGSDLDAANVRALDGTPGVNTSTDGRQGYGEATIQLGELPTNGGDVETGLEWLEHLTSIMDKLVDYPLISEEVHSEYIDELASDAWGHWLADYLQNDLIDLAMREEIAIPKGLAHHGYAVDDHSYYVEHLWNSHEDAIREAYYSYEQNEWNAESATSVTNGCHEDAVLHVARTVFRWVV